MKRKPRSCNKKIILYLFEHKLMAKYEFKKSLSLQAGYISFVLSLYLPFCFLPLFEQSQPQREPYKIHVHLEF